VKVVIQTLGSAGDTYPFIGIGKELVSRGHEVVVFANEVFARTIRSGNLRFAEMGDAEAFDMLAGDSAVWNPRRGIQIIFDAVADHLEEAVEMVESEAGDADVLVNSSLGWASRIVRDKRGIPLVTAHLSPALFRSSVRLPRTEVMWVRDSHPMWVKRLWWRVADVLVGGLVDRRLNSVRTRYGLTPVHRILQDWAVYSPDVTLGLFPDWFGPPQPDWPHPVRLTGFPLFDGSDEDHVEDSLSGWVEAGDAPFVFTSGSANRHSGEYFRAAVSVADRLGIRSVLVTSNNADVPGSLPPHVRWEPYVPYSWLLPRSRALVSNGGIGTCAQALAAGIPQLVVHANFDQRDNGSRISDLEAGLHMPVSRFEGEAAISAMRSLDDPEVRANAARLAGLVDGPAARAAACDAIEHAARTGPRRVGP
jgi:rhamnosyltransferase subunit B